MTFNLPIKKKIFYLLVFSIFLFAVLAAFFYPRSRYYVKREIERANYCQAKEDCVFVGNECPFGCYIYVNKNEADRIKNLISAYNAYPHSSRCVYGCISCQDVHCQDNKCQPVCR